MPVIPSYFERQMPPTSRVGEGPTASSLPIRKHYFQTPKVRIHLNDLGDEGSSIFLSNIKGHEDIENQIQNVLNLLYDADDIIPQTRSVTLVLKQMRGVAYTTGIELDNDHKEIAISLSYITDIKLSPPRNEILGVICHELVHCYQWVPRDDCPVGLKEGIADWVRLRAGLGAKHWKQTAEGRWDVGYEQTAYFFDYLEERFGKGTIRKLNGCLRVPHYDEEALFGQCCQGHTVKELWKDYKKELRKDKKTGAPTSEDDDAHEPVPTHAT